MNKCDYERILKEIQLKLKMNKDIPTELMFVIVFLLIFQEKLDYKMLKEVCEKAGFEKYIKDIEKLELEEKNGVL